MSPRLRPLRRPAGPDRGVFGGGVAGVNVGGLTPRSTEDGIVNTWLCTSIYTNLYKAHLIREGFVRWTAFGCIEGPSAAGKTEVPGNPVGAVGSTMVRRPRFVGMIVGYDFSRNGGEDTGAQRVAR